MDVKQYIGQELYLGDMPEAVQRAAAISMKNSIAFYGDTVDGQMIRDQIRLCDETEDYVYSEYTPLEIKYQRGSRPELERILDRILTDSDTERDRVLRILRFVRDLHKLRPGKNTEAAGDLFHGGIEEEVIKKCSNMCNEQARVFCVLCQVAGIPARYVGHYIDRHGVNEAYVEGKWAYFDNEGRYFLTPDGTIAGVRELRRNPELVTTQAPEVVAEARTRFPLERSEREFCRVEVTVMTNYFAWESARYNYDWIWPTDEFHARMNPLRSAFPEELSHENVVAMIRGKRPWPE